MTIVGGRAVAAEDNPAFFFGVDLSYVNEMDDCGAVYRVHGEVRDAFEIFAEYGASLVRARLWHNPDWTDYSTLADVKRTFQRAVNAGMATLLDFHYSDNWADPRRQEIPAAWEQIKDAGQLAEAVYQYTYNALFDLYHDDLTPSFVQIGNETNSGLLKHEGEDLDWGYAEPLFNAGIRAVRDFARETSTNPQVILHIAQPENAGWWFTEAETVGLTDFDVIGISYYPQWSTFSIADMGAQVSYLRQRFGKNVMVVETAYAWTRDSVNETADNILNQGIRGYGFTPEGQRRFMIDLTQSLISNGASGVVYWEPGWVSTQCSTRWGQGSHWENATLFDFHNGNEVLEGIDFLNHDYWYPEFVPDGVIDSSFGEPLIEDSLGDVLDGIPAFDLSQLYVIADQYSLSMALTLAGDVYSERGNYLIYLDTTHDILGADGDPARRPITAADPYHPEFRLDVTIQEERGTVSGSYVLNAWIDNQWETITFTGGAAITTGKRSVIELQIPRILLRNPEELNIAVISSNRGQASTAGDILGTDDRPADWSDPLVLDVFHPYRLPD